MHGQKVRVLTVALGMVLCSAVLAQQTPSSPSMGTDPSATPPRTGAPTPARGTMDFGAIDADRDGFISRAEATGVGLGGQFTTLDKNNDGRLDRSEFAAYRGDDSPAPGMQSGASTPPTR